MINMYYLDFPIVCTPERRELSGNKAFTYRRLIGYNLGNKGFTDTGLHGSHIPPFPQLNPPRS